MSFLVIGGTGKTGRRVATRLQALGHEVRIASRATGFDWDTPATWDAALAGAKSIYVVPHPLRVNPADQVKDLLSRTGGRVVFLSARDIHSPAEPAVREHAGGWTLLRPSWFAQNFSEDFFAPGVEAKHLALPTGEGKEPFVDLEDVADVAVAALTDTRHDGQTYELAGPELLSFREAAALIDPDITYTPVTPATYRAELSSYGLADEHVELMVRLLVNIADGKDAYLSDGVERVLGRSPRTFADYVTTTWP